MENFGEFFVTEILFCFGMYFIGYLLICMGVSLIQEGASKKGEGTLESGGLIFLGIVLGFGMAVYALLALIEHWRGALIDLGIIFILWLVYKAKADV